MNKGKEEVFQEDDDINSIDLGSQTGNFIHFTRNCKDNIVTVTCTLKYIFSEFFHFFSYSILLKLINLVPLHVKLYLVPTLTSCLFYFLKNSLNAKNSLLQVNKSPKSVIKSRVNVFTLKICQMEPASCLAYLSFYIF